MQIDIDALSYANKIFRFGKKNTAESIILLTLKNGAPHSRLGNTTSAQHCD